MTTIFRMDGIPFWKDVIDNFDSIQDTAIKKIHELEKTHESKTLSNINGYQSPNTFHLEPKGQIVKDVFEVSCKSASIAVQELERGCDLSIALSGVSVNINNSRKCYNSIHTEKNVLTLILFVSVPENSGNLCIYNPSLNDNWEGYQFFREKNEFTSRALVIKPKEGGIICFPSYLPYSIEPNDHDDEFMWMSFNIVLY